jgi:hypothetical protein
MTEELESRLISNELGELSAPEVWALYSPRAAPLLS